IVPTGTLLTSIARHLVDGSSESSRSFQRQSRMIQRPALRANRVDYAICCALAAARERSSGRKRTACGPYIPGVATDPPPYEIPRIPASAGGLIFNGSRQ